MAAHFRHTTVTKPNEIMNHFKNGYMGLLSGLCVGKRAFWDVALHFQCQPPSHTMLVTQPLQCI